MIQNLKANNLALPDSNLTVKSISADIGFFAQDVNNLIKYAKDLGLIIQQKTTSPNEFLSNIKVVTAEINAIYIQATLEIKNINLASIGLDTQKLANLFSGNTISGKDVTSAYTTILNLVGHIIKLIGDITSGNLGQIAQDAINLFNDAKVATILLIKGLKKLKDFTVKYVEPKLNKMVIKLDKMGDKIKDDFKDFGKKVKDNNEKVDEWFKKVFSKLHNDTQDNTKKDNSASDQSKNLSAVNDKSVANKDVSPVSDIKASISNSITNKSSPDQSSAVPTKPLMTKTLSKTKTETDLSNFKASALKKTDVMSDVNNIVNNNSPSKALAINSKAALDNGDYDINELHNFYDQQLLSNEF